MGVPTPSLIPANNVLKLQFVNEQPSTRSFTSIANLNPLNSQPSHTMLLTTFASVLSKRNAAIFDAPSTRSEFTKGPIKPTFDSFEEIKPIKPTLNTNPYVKPSQLPNRRIFGRGGGNGGNGAVRIIWGEGRSFPNNAA